MPTYNPNDMETVILNSQTISGNIISTTDTIDNIVVGVDKRVYDYFEFFRELENRSGLLRAEDANAAGFNSWMGDTVGSFNRVQRRVGDLANEATPPLDLTPEASHIKYPSITVDPNKVVPYKLTSEAWENLSTKDKKAIEAKLKELGFTQEEIDAIKNGNATVNKTVLDALDGALEKLNNDGSDVRQVILEQYGFDVFNEDGTINRDKLALALLIDGKNPTDDYDLLNLLKTKYGIDLFPTNTVQPVEPGTNPINPTLPTPGDNENQDGSTPQNIHTGLSFGGDAGNGSTNTDLSEIDDILNGEQEFSLLDNLDDLSGALLTNNGLFGLAYNNSGNSGGNSTAIAAGVAGLGAAATAASILIQKKKEGSNLLDDDEFNEDDDEEFSDEDAKEELSSKSDDKNSNDEPELKNKKNWLYGLGIGLAGTGLLAGVLSDDDEDENGEE